MNSDRELVNVWQEAAHDLGIEIVAPYVCSGESCPLLVPGFGRPAGAIPLWIDDLRSQELLKNTSYYVSFLNPEVHGKYDRATFVEMLVDWAWFGNDNNAPPWYKEAAGRLSG